MYFRPYDEWQDKLHLGKNDCTSLKQPPSHPPASNGLFQMEGVGKEARGGVQRRGSYHQIAISTKLSLHATDSPSLI